MYAALVPILCVLASVLAQEDDDSSRSGRHQQVEIAAKTHPDYARYNYPCKKHGLHKPTNTSYLEDLTLRFTNSRRKAKLKRPVWTYRCKDRGCEKVPATIHNTWQSLEVCKLLCTEYAALWPKPTGEISVGSQIQKVNRYSISVEITTAIPKVVNEKTRNVLSQMATLFRQQINDLFQKSLQDEGKADGGQSLILYINVQQPDIISFAQDVDESYELEVNEMSDGRINATITADTIFGARHGMETLGQLIVFDSISKSVVIPLQVFIQDAPFYPYRGILLDTARNFISIPVIKRTIDAMAVNKLNTFHWHMTDTHSFPFQTTTFPQLTRYGAYSPAKIYTVRDIQNLIEYARIRGVRIIPEFDAPSHVGEGWQWAAKHNATVCFNAEPWRHYCVEPPCGLLNPTSEYMYDILRGIYTDMENVFDSDIFHMGGDEVQFDCWNTTEQIVRWMQEKDMDRDNTGFLELWSYFQKRALSILDSVSSQEHPIVLWTSKLTKDGHAEKYLNNSRYIVQIWTKGDDPEIAELVNYNFSVIFSNYDALYFDCGFQAWIGPGNNWCSPYIGWQTVYDNDPIHLLGNLGVNITENPAKQKLILGEEAALWTEQADDQSVDQRLWPRAAAMAERLWTNPKTSWTKAETRFVHHRDRLVSKGIAADSLKPGWCVQNDGYCNA